MIAELLSQAMQYHREGNLQAAERLYREVLQQQPDQPNALYALGLLAHQVGNLEQAIDLYQQAITARPDYADAHNNLGAALQQQGNLEQAFFHYQAALRIQPNNPSPNVNLGAILQQQGKLEAAIARYQKALRLNPNLPEAHKNLGSAFKEQGNLDQAIGHFQTAVQLLPQHPDYHRELGDALQEQGRIDAAIAVLDQAIVQFPDHIKLWGSRIRARLISGNLLQGFAEYDTWRLGIASPARSFTQPVWDGADLHGKTILLHAETGSGMGDTIQFIRYVPLVAQRGGRVIVECQPPLVRLFESIEAIATIIPTGNPLPPFDLHASLLSLPRLFATTLQTIPPPLPLSLPPLPLSPAALNVGITWGGDPNHLHDQTRSCPVQEFRTFLGKPGITFYSLQKGAHQPELAAVENLEVIDLSDRLSDFADTAAIIQQLDLVITVDTAVAHLAGTLGKPVWVLLSFAADWRWLMGRSDSPWYPTARLFRQPRPNDWQTVCGQVAAALDDARKGNRLFERKPENSA